MTFQDFFLFGFVWVEPLRMHLEFGEKAPQLSFEKRIFDCVNIFSLFPPKKLFFLSSLFSFFGSYSNWPREFFPLPQKIWVNWPEKYEFCAFLFCDMFFFAQLLKVIPMFFGHADHRRRLWTFFGGCFLPRFRYLVNMPNQAENFQIEAS